MAASRMGGEFTNPALKKSLGIAAISGCVCIVLADGIGILIRHHYNPISRSVSDLALGPTGWVQDIGMYLGGMGIMACAAGLYFVLSRNWEIRLGELFLLLVGAGILLAAIFKETLPGHNELITGEVHAVSSITAAISFLPVCFLVSPALRDHKKLFAYTIAAGILAIVLEVGRGRLPPDWVFFGLHERLIGANALAWISMVAWVLLVKQRKSVRSGLT